MSTETTTPTPCSATCSRPSRRCGAWAERALLCASLTLAACARTLPDTVSPDELAMGAPPGGGPTRIAEVAPEPPAVLTRTVLTHAVERGFPWFLVRIEVSPVVQAGRFVGYRLDAARDLRRWNEAGLDLHVGDVVTRVNGGSIERPDAAMGVFQAMRDAQEVTVDVVREGRAVTLRVPVGAL